MNLILLFQIEVSTFLWGVKAGPFANLFARSTVSVFAASAAAAPAFTALKKNKRTAKRRRSREGPLLKSQGPLNLKAERNVEPCHRGRQDQGNILGYKDGSKTEDAG